MPAKKLLILGGTQEGAKLARMVVDVMGDRVETTVSYSGITGHQPDLPCQIRVGGFGGASGLAKYLEDEKIDFIVDATHPFAEKISQNAYMASKGTDVAVLTLKRPPWVAQPGDRWLEVDSIAQAVDLLAEIKAPTFVTTGIKDLEHFSGLEDVPLLVRLVNPPKEDLSLSNYQCVIARPPFSVEDEIKLLRDHKIKVLVTKNSGGDQTKAKLIAAREEKINVIMINRPPAEPLEETSVCENVLKWLVAHGA